MDQNLRDLERIYQETGNPWDLYRLRVAKARDGSLTDLRIGDIVEVIEVETPWINGLWVGQVVNFRPTLRLTDVKLLEKRVANWRDSVVKTEVLCLTPEDQITVIVPASPEVEARIIASRGVKRNPSDPITGQISFGPEEKIYLCKICQTRVVQPRRGRKNVHDKCFRKREALRRKHQCLICKDEKVPGSSYCQECLEVTEHLREIEAFQGYEPTERWRDYSPITQKAHSVRGTPRGGKRIIRKEID